jgi:hypothetical protein
MPACELGTDSHEYGLFQAGFKQKYNLDLTMIENFAPNPVPTGDFCPDRTWHFG